MENGQRKMRVDGMSLISPADGRQQQKVAAVLCNALMDPPRKSGQHQGKRGAVLFISFHCPAVMMMWVALHCPARSPSLIVAGRN